MMEFKLDASISILFSRWAGECGGRDTKKKPPQTNKTNFIIDSIFCRIVCKNHHKCNVHARKRDHVCFFPSPCHQFINVITLYENSFFSYLRLPCILAVIKGNINFAASSHIHYTRISLLFIPSFFFFQFSSPYSGNFNEIKILTTTLNAIHILVSIK